MQKLFSNRKLVIVVVCLIISIGFMTFSVSVRDRKSTPPLIQQFGNDVVGFADQVVSIPANSITSGIGSIHGLFNTYQENQELKQKVSQITATQVRNQSLQVENSKLKSQLKLNATLTSYQTINASVISRTPSSWQNQLIINKGSNNGIKKDMSVLVDKGLAGRVSEVNRTNSKVELLTNNNEATDRFAVQLAAKDGKIINGIITGYSNNSNLIEMGNINSKATIKEGTRVLTSGLGGVTPKGLYIGSVQRVSSDDYGLSSKIYIKPAANFNDIEVVTVVGKN